MTDEHLALIKAAKQKFFAALSASPGSLTLGPEVHRLSWELHRAIEEGPVVYEICDECGCTLDNGATCGYHPDCGACGLRRSEATESARQHPHDHQDYCEGCQSITDMWIEDATRCEVCRTKYPNGY